MYDRLTVKVTKLQQFLNSTKKMPGEGGGGGGHIRVNRNDFLTCLDDTVLLFTNRDTALHSLEASHIPSVASYSTQRICQDVSMSFVL